MPISIINGIGSTGLREGDGIGTGGLSDAAAGATLLVYDSFTDTNGALLLNHTPDTDTLGTGWQPIVGIAGDFATWTIQSNYLEADSTSTTNRAAGWQPGSFPYIQECARDATNPNTDSYVGTRFIDAANLFYGWLFDDNRLLLREREGGSEVTRGDTGAGATINTMWIADDGEEITVGSDRGAARITYTTTLHNTSTDCGVWGRNTLSDLDDYYLMSGTVSPGDLP